MSVILEITIHNDDFQLGELLSGSPRMHLELERIVPTGGVMMPFVWAVGDDHDAFRKQVQADPRVQAVLELDRIGESGLYRIEWADVPSDLILGIAQTEAVIIEARGNEEWVFRLRFQDHNKLSVFHNYVIDHEIPIHIERTYTLTEETERGHRFGLSQEQREALILALQRGYFETPKEVRLDELADELGITRQALSNRIRRGNQKVLHSVLLSSSTDSNLDTNYRVD